LKLLEKQGCGAVKGNKAMIRAYVTCELRLTLPHQQIHLGVGDFGFSLLVAAGRKFFRRQLPE
jgi:hypothetical protein